MNTKKKNYTEKQLRDILNKLRRANFGDIREHCRARGHAFNPGRLGCPLCNFYEGNGYAIEQLLFIFGGCPRFVDLEKQTTPGGK
ncbi:MAG: hypothetical protein KGL39_52730 [Patescibacteria group bacterium]|nr:hypothetical protein [Patescibacteria group bacterium]